jgi:hydroxymethylglutaryl-CoA reductase
VNVINAAKTSIIQELNMECENMVKRGGGVKDLKVRELNSQSLSENNKHYSVDIYIDVCNAMGANITNTIAEKTKEIISKMGVQTGISVLTNYCLERKSVSSFIIPV